MVEMVFSKVGSKLPEQQPHFMRLNGFFHRVITVKGYPRMVADGWLDRLNRPKIDFDWSMMIRPQALESTLVQLNHQLVKQKSDLISSNQKGLVNPSLQIQHDDTLLLLNRLQMGQERLFDLSFYVNCRAKNKKDLDSLTQHVMSELNGLLMIPRIAYFQMAQGLQSMLPVQVDALNQMRSIPSESLSACFPFTSRFLDETDSGILMGLNSSNDSPVLLDPFSLPNHNGLVLGSSGSGKSFLVKLMIMRHLLTPTQVIIIDPQNEYCSIVEKFNGKIIHVTGLGELGFNIFELGEENVKSKIQSLIPFFQLLLQDHSSELRCYLQMLLTKWYRKKELCWNDFLVFFKKGKSEFNNPSKVDDWWSQLQFLTGGEEVKNSARLNHESLVSFDLLHVPNTQKPAFMYLILNHARSWMIHENEQKLLVLDEAWSLMQQATANPALFELVKTARKFKLGVTMITQEVNDLVANPAGQTLLANTAWKMILRQDSSTIQQIQQVLHLSTAEQKKIAHLRRGEGLLLKQKEHIVVEVVASPFEHALIHSSNG